jgi:hypothetical protein
MWRILLFAAALGCGDNKAARHDGGLDDAGVDAPPNALRHCNDATTELTRPPTERLPCDLLPPGFGQ